ncbi:hypothetical protein B0A48_00479 [Cryoendolithus antarcticus]|uniref:C2H2-type domain-containing protein n=1 Tax=Cryoendolithus antarcticus TaxID=1507870 RepID=A0A1V8TUS3_9PEZI|nr:hypothetical protein B0A48_00479 [Cryoendolithus antarcticus]
MKCPLSDRCTGVFTSPSALLFHLESNTWKSGMTREKQNSVVAKYDVNRHITGASGTVSHAAVENDRGVSATALPRSTPTIDSLSILDASGVVLTPTNMSVGHSIAPANGTYAGSTLSASSGVMLTPSASIVGSEGYGEGSSMPGPSVRHHAAREWYFLNGASPVVTPTSFSLSMAINPNAAGQWPGHLCSCTFRKQYDLQQHLGSITHAPSIFHCPTALLGLSGSTKKMRSFKTLSGLAQHLEAGACIGGTGVLGMIAEMVEREIERAGGGKEDQEAILELCSELLEAALENFALAGITPNRASCGFDTRAAPYNIPFGVGAMRRQLVRLDVALREGHMRMLGGEVHLTLQAIARSRCPVVDLNLGGTPKDQLSNSSAFEITLAPWNAPWANLARLRVVLGLSNINLDFHNGQSPFHIWLSSLHALQEFNVAFEWPEYRHLRIYNGSLESIDAEDLTSVNPEKMHTEAGEVVDLDPCRREMTTADGDFDFYISGTPDRVKAAFLEQIDLLDFEEDVGSELSDDSMESDWNVRSWDALLEQDDVEPDREAELLAPL